MRSAFLRAASRSSPWPTSEQKPDDLGVVLLLQPDDGDRRVEAARIREDDLHGRRTTTSGVMAACGPYRASLASECGADRVKRCGRRRRGIGARRCAGRPSARGREPSKSSSSVRCRRRGRAARARRSPRPRRRDVGVARGQDGQPLERADVGGEARAASSGRAGSMTSTMPGGRRLVASSQGRLGRRRRRPPGRRRPCAARAASMRCAARAGARARRRRRPASSDPAAVARRDAGGPSRRRGGSARRSRARGRRRIAARPLGRRRAPSTRP